MILSLSTASIQLFKDEYIIRKKNDSMLVRYNVFK
jgi:hypothetical protein